MGYWHPLKGSCQQKTLHHRKRATFFCRDKVQYGVRPVLCLHPIFLKACCAESIKLLTGIHQDQGQREKTSRVLSEEAIQPRSGTAVLLCSPWSEFGPQKKIGTLSKPMGCYKIWGSYRASHGELLKRADQLPDNTPVNILVGSAAVYQPSYRDFHHHHVRITAAVPN